MQYQEDIIVLIDENAQDNTISNVIDIGYKEYNHKEFIIKEVRQARLACFNNPSSGNLLSVILWLETLVHELDKELIKESIKIAA